jgi:hypothetical protein
MPISREGREYKYRDKKLTVYPISVLAEKLSEALGEDRTTQTIRKWEVNKVIPPAIFRVGQKRVYTIEQIEIICKVAKECGIKQGYSLSLTNFSTRVWDEMRELNRIYIK